MLQYFIATVCVQMMQFSCKKFQHFFKKVFFIIQSFPYLQPQMKSINTNSWWWYTF